MSQAMARPPPPPPRGGIPRPPPPPPNAIGIYYLKLLKIIF